MFDHVQNLQRYDRFADLAADGLPEHAEHWMRHMIRDRERCWCRGGGYAFRYVRRGVMQWRIGATHTMDEGTVRGDTDAELYSALASAIATAAAATIVKRH